MRRRGLHNFPRGRRVFRYLGPDLVDLPDPCPGPGPGPGGSLPDVVGALARRWAGCLPL